MICPGRGPIGQNGDVTDHHTHTDALLDRLVYAPLGLLGEVGSMVPDLAAKGRVRVANAKMMGQFAVQMGRAEATRRTGLLEAQVREFLMGAGLIGRDPAPTAAASPQAAAAPSRGAPVQVVAPPVESLAISDYDSLAASQVVSRLPGLTAEQLQEVHDYERSKRGRKTILGKIAQLQG